MCAWLGLYYSYYYCVYSTCSYFIKQNSYIITFETKEKIYVQSNLLKEIDYPPSPSIVYQYLYYYRSRKLVAPYKYYCYETAVLLEQNNSFQIKAVVSHRTSTQNGIQQ